MTISLHPVRHTHAHAHTYESWLYPTKDLSVVCVRAECEKSHHMEPKAATMMRDFLARLDVDLSLFGSKTQFGLFRMVVMIWTKSGEVKGDRLHLSWWSRRHRAKRRKQKHWGEMRRQQGQRWRLNWSCIGFKPLTHSPPPTLLPPAAFKELDGKSGAAANKHKAHGERDAGNYSDVRGGQCRRSENRFLTSDYTLKCPWAINRSLTIMCVLQKRNINNNFN